MAKQNQVQSRTYEAGADLSADQFKIVKLSAGQVVLQSASNLLSTGVLQGNPSAQGQAADVAYAGQVKIIAGAAVSQDALVMSDTVGRAITGTGAGNLIIGQARHAAGAAGELLEVDLNMDQPALA